MRRVLLFLITNLAILVVLGTVLKLLGVEPYLSQQGINYESLLIFAAVFGMGGAFVSLALSKWMAKRLTGAEVITSPGSEKEAWLVHTVSEIAGSAGIGIPEVAIYRAEDMNAFATGMRRDNSLVAVSAGLLQRMDREEVRAVLAHGGADLGERNSRADIGIRNPARPSGKMVAQVPRHSDGPVGFQIDLRSSE